MTREESKSSVPFARQRHPQIIGAPPPLEMAAPVRKSRSMSELPGHLRVPILKRKDTERTQARLEAGAAGVAELQALREQHQQLVTATMEESKQKSQHKKQRKKEREDRHSRYQSVQVKKPIFWNVLCRV
ncbi:uncharacterized protein LOC101858146 [Aplysia californica]|uniref:Uncharacterized protein LOC101858146 n=1 Tax=Aplysia californica TaxID=6500 RepID=A0ABM1W387_APLCA|nr:uncharacterized protein LOC101858146 [Aplysia californica]